jgi:Ran GTPase-activating protein (RanGAP) involved in mRNA processing and transport
VTRDIDLDLSLCALQPYDVKSLAQSLTRFSEARSLRLGLSHNNVTNSGIGHLIDSLRTLRHLNSLELRLDKVHIDAKGSQALGLALPQLAPLQHLSLSLIHNNLTEEGIWPIAKGVADLNASLTSLKLVLISNGLKAEAGEILASMLQKLPSLAALNLNLYQNRLAAAGGVALAKGFSNLKALHTLELDLFFNNITEVGATAFKQALADVKQIKRLRLNLDFNYIELPGAEQLA